jgi:hypothetical protein
MDPLVKRVADRFATENPLAGEGDDAKSLEGAKKFIEHLMGLAEKAKHELASKGEPGAAMSYFVGAMNRVRDEDWYEHWYR